MSGMNKQITLAARPAALPKESDFKIVDAPIPSPKDGQVLVRILYLSVDPYMRSRMNDAKSYAEPVKLGEVMEGGAVGRVLESKNPQYRPDDIVVGSLGWQ